MKRGTSLVYDLTSAQQAEKDNKTPNGLVAASRRQVIALRECNEKVIVVNAVLSWPGKCTALKTEPIRHYARCECL